MAVPVYFINIFSIYFKSVIYSIFTPGAIISTLCNNHC